MARRTGSGTKPGDGSALRPVTGVQWLWRGQFLAEVEGAEYAVDVDYFDVDEVCRLYRDGVQVATATSPARFDVEAAHGVRIEAAMSFYGMKRVHVVGPRGARLMTPAPGTAEVWRQRLAERRPGLSIALAVLSFAVVVLALVLEMPQLVEWFTRTDVWSRISSWTFSSPVSLSAGANTALTAAGVVAGLERALRLKHRWLLDD